MDPIFGAIQQNLDSALSVPFVSSSVLLGLAFYAYKAAPELPSFVEEMFLNVFFQIFVGFMILYMNTRNVMLSFIVSIVFVYGVYLFAKVKENMFGGSDPFSKFMESEFEQNLTAKIKEQKAITPNVSEEQIQKLAIETIQENYYYTPDALGDWIYKDDKHDLSALVNNAKKASSVSDKNNIYKKKWTGMSNNTY